MNKEFMEDAEWVYGDDLNKWVECIECDFQYYIEYYELNAKCPICSSTEYDESHRAIGGL